METAIFNPNPSKYREYNLLLGANESTKPRIRHKRSSITTLINQLENTDYECPMCKSDEVRYYFVDEDLNEIAANNNPCSQQGACKNCGHTDELTYFKTI